MLLVSFMLWPLYPRYPSDRRLCGPQSRSGRSGKISWPYRDSNSNPSVVHLVAIILPLHTMSNFALPCRDETLKWPDQRNEAENTKETYRKYKLPLTYIHTSSLYLLVMAWQLHKHWADSQLPSFCGTGAVFSSTKFTCWLPAYNIVHIKAEYYFNHC
jgi:hypothetical protein